MGENHAAKHRHEKQGYRKKHLTQHLSLQELASKKVAIDVHLQSVPTREKSRPLSYRRITNIATRRLRRCFVAQGRVTQPNAIGTARDYSRCFVCGAVSGRNPVSSPPQPPNSCCASFSIVFLAFNSYPGAACFFRRSGARSARTARRCKI